jgi:peptidoglycan/xylan/chitin deacetylase (PgdA/CDA1 family)
VKWPDGKRCAVSITFDYDGDEVWLSADPSNAQKPALLSQGQYGSKVGVSAVLDVLGRHKIRGSFFVIGRLTEKYEDSVIRILEAGHEVGVHGYTHDHPLTLSAEEEREDLTKVRDVLKALGAECLGYRSPGWEFSPATLGLLGELGYQYSSNFMDDINPYIHPGSDIVELPVQFILDDAAHWWFGVDDWVKKISTNSEVREIWQDEVLGIRDLGGCAIITMHPQVIGRPGRLRFLDEFLKFLRELPDVWIATCHEIADHAYQQLNASTDEGSAR